jgi:hypothetical protein
MLLLLQLLQLLLLLLSLLLLLGAACWGCLLQGYRPSEGWQLMGCQHSSVRSGPLLPHQPLLQQQLLLLPVPPLPRPRLLRCRRCWW